MKLCPFCGGIAKLNAPGYRYYSPCWCKCTQCGAEGPTKSSELEAEKGWNERAQKEQIDTWLEDRQQDEWTNRAHEMGGNEGKMTTIQIIIAVLFVISVIVMILIIKDKSK